VTCDTYVYSVLLKPVASRYSLKAAVLSGDRTQNEKEVTEEAHTSSEKEMAPELRKGCIASATSVIQFPAQTPRWSGLSDRR